jgi:hypothetical protein
VLVMIFALLAPIVLVAGTSKFPGGPVSLVLLLLVILSRGWRREPVRAAGLPQEPRRAAESP